MIRRPPRSTLFPSATLFRSALRPRPRRDRGMLHRPGRDREALVLPPWWRRPSGGRCAGGRPAQKRGPDERGPRSEEHTSELQSPCNLVCRLLLDKDDKCGITALNSFYFFNDTATTQIHPLSLRDALPICASSSPSP